MKVIKTLGVVAAAMLVLVSCEKKEAVLYNQIKEFPTDSLTTAYLNEFADGEHADSVRNYYVPLAKEINLLTQSPDYLYLMDLARCQVSDSVKNWAMSGAEVVLLDSIQYGGTRAMCETFLSTFPQSANKAQVESRLQQIQAEEAEAARRASAKIESLMSKYAECIEIGLDVPFGGNWWEGAVIDADRCHRQLKSYAGQMNSQQKARYNRLNGQLKRLMNGNY